MHAIHTADSNTVMMPIDYTQRYYQAVKPNWMPSANLRSHFGYDQWLTIDIKPVARESVLQMVDCALHRITDLRY